MAQSRQGGRSGASASATAVAESSATAEHRVEEVTWSRAVIAGNSKGEMPYLWKKPFLGRWFGKWLPFWLIPVAAALIGLLLFGYDHIEDDVIDDAPEMTRELLRSKGLDDDISGLEFDTTYRNVEVSGVLPAGITAAELEEWLEESDGVLDDKDNGFGLVDGADIRNATVLASEAAPAQLGPIDVAASSDGETIVLTGEVPSEAHRDELVAAAQATGLDVDDRLTVSGLDPSAGDANAQIGLMAGAIGGLAVGTFAAADLAIGDSGPVTGNVDALTGDAAASIASAVGSDVTVSAPDPLGNLDVDVSYDGTGIVLTGDVLDEDDSARLEAAAANVVGAANVTNNLNVLGLDEAVEGSDAKIDALGVAMGTFDGLLSGDAALNDSDLTVNGLAADPEAQAETDAAVDASSAVGLRPGGVVEVEVDEEPEFTLQDEIDLLQAELDALQDEIRENVVFASNSAELTPVAQGTLDKVVAAMDRYTRPVVETSGHTDSQGNDAFNLDLSQRRADSVVAYIVSQGIDENRLNPVGFGETQPVAENTTEEGRLQNRRVEFTARESF